MTRESKITPRNTQTGGGPAPPPELPSAALLHVADEIENLDRVRPELLGELVLDRRRGRHEAGLVDALDHLDAELLQPVRRLRLELERARRLVLRHLVGRRLHPALLLVGQAVPGLLRDPDAVVVRLVLGDREDR